MRSGFGESAWRSPGLHCDRLAQQRADGRVQRRGQRDQQIVGLADDPDVLSITRDGLLSFCEWLYCTGKPSVAASNAE